MADTATGACLLQDITSGADTVVWELPPVGLPWDRELLHPPPPLRHGLLRNSSLQQRMQTTLRRLLSASGSSSSSSLSSGMAAAVLPTASLASSPSKEPAALPLPTPAPGAAAEAADGAVSCAAVGAPTGQLLQEVDVHAQLQARGLDAAVAGAVLDSGLALGLSFWVAARCAGGNALPGDLKHWLACAWLVRWVPMHLAGSCVGARVLVYDTTTTRAAGHAHAGPTTTRSSC